MEIRATGRARAVVRKFFASLGPGENVYEEKRETSESTLFPRPARLGLGAKYIPHSTEGQAKAERKIRGSLRREQNLDSRDDGCLDDVVDDGESRTAMIGKRTKKQAGRRDPKINISVSAKAPGKVGNEDLKNSVSKEERGESEASNGILRRQNFIPALSASRHDGKDIPTDRELVGNDDAEANNSGLQKQNGMKNSVPGEQKGVNGAHWDKGKLENVTMSNPNDFESLKKLRRKRTRTRSRKKNLKRDKRTSLQKPAHLSEQTLKDGRVKSKP